MHKLVCLSFFGIFSIVSSVCYFTSWTIYRNGNGKFNTSHIDPSLCTHILYAFVGINENGELWLMDPWEAIKPYGYGLNEIPNLLSLKKNNPDLKILLSMGGWNECESNKYSVVAESPTKRIILIQSVLKFLDKYKFDGFDFDWEYPSQRNGEPEDKDNFIILLRELKAALNAKGLILSAAVSGGVESSNKSYNIKAVSDNLDMINVMTYDYHGAFEPFVGHYAPLHASSLDRTSEEKNANVATGIRYWLEQGADPSKINMGIGTYGRTFTLANPSNASLYATAYSGGQGGKYTNANGVLGYNEICEFNNDWPITWDQEQQVPHKVKGNQWVGYDDVKSLTLKVEFAKSKKLGGIMIWSLDTDDFLGNCGNGKYPLLKAVNKALK